jgi:hypothetical protein
VAIGEAIATRLAPFGIASATDIGHFQKAERSHLTYRWRDGVALDAVTSEVIEGGRQLAVVGAAMLRVLDLDTVEQIS